MAAAAATVTSRQRASDSSMAAAAATDDSDRAGVDHSVLADEAWMTRSRRKRTPSPPRSGPTFPIDLQKEIDVVPDPNRAWARNREAPTNPNIDHSEVLTFDCNGPVDSPLAQCIQRGYRL